MTTRVARQPEGNTPEVVLHVALELSEKRWKLAFTTGLGQKPRQRSVAGGDVEAVLREIEQAKRRFGLPDEVRVVSCYEAGMEGFWVHRALVGRGIENRVVDSSSIDVKRRRRRSKSDRLDASALVVKLVQYESGHRKVWSVVHVPPEEAEDLRQTHRELESLGSERTAVVSSIRGLLKAQGIRIRSVRGLPAQLETLRRWDGAEVPPELRARLIRSYQRLEWIEEQIEAVENRREQILKAAGDGATGEVVDQAAAKARQLMVLKSLGAKTSWALATELFGWRKFQNRRQLGGLLGIVPVHEQSGDGHRELSISKAGNPQLRSLLVELAWNWLRYQPGSELSRWYERKFGAGSGRQRRIGIVALARKLVIELWKYLETGTLPEGALTKA